MAVKANQSGVRFEFIFIISLRVFIFKFQCGALDARTRSRFNRALQVLAAHIFNYFQSPA